MTLSAQRELTTKRCMLRCPRQSDADAILNAVSHPDFPRDVPFGQLATHEDVAGAIERRLERWESGSAFEWCADERSTGNLIAMIGLRRGGGSSTWSLGYWVDPRSWRKGFATELGRRVLAIAFEDLEIAMMTASAGAWNVASQRVLSKLGFTFRRENPDGYRIQNRAIPTVEFDLSNIEWRARSLSDAG
jgi:[ribosomal protein S5]-alanine N-acetyltransferase